MLPLTVQLHELGHYLGYVVFGFEAPVLSHASAGFAEQSEFWAHLQAGEVVAARRISNIGQTGLAALAGPVLSWLMIGLGLVATLRTGRIVGVAIAVAAAARFPLVVISAVLGGGPSTDEGRAALALMLPHWLMYLTAALAPTLAVGGAWLLLRRSGDERLLAAVGVGTVAGIALWMGVLGPRMFG